jgi:hypothetical protein
VKCSGPASDEAAAYMDWLKARSLRKLGSIRATLSVFTDDAPAAGGVVELVEVEVAVEPQAAAARARAVPRMSITGRRNGWVFMIITSIGRV